MIFHQESRPLLFVRGYIRRSAGYAMVWARVDKRPGHSYNKMQFILCVYNKEKKAREPNEPRRTMHP